MQFNNIITIIYLHNMMNRQTTKKHHRRHRKAKTISLVLVLLISLLCYLATTACGVVSALSADEVAAKYPDCNVDVPSRSGDGRCYGGEYNTEACGSDGDDCVEFNEKYPNCNVDYPAYIGDGFCDGGEYNTEECGWDGGDCEPPADNSAEAVSSEVLSLCVVMANLFIFG